MSDQPTTEEVEAGRILIRHVCRERCPASRQDGRGVDCECAMEAARRFAALRAEVERLRAERDAEREACAQVAVDWIEFTFDPVAMRRVAAAIRERKP